MQFKTTNLVLLATILAASAEACKCNIDHVNHPIRTQTCCNELGGVFSNGDCAANSISNDLSEFSACCKQTNLVSDCPCPSGCGGADTDDEGTTDKREETARELATPVVLEKQSRHFQS
jgi:hypothetical protein